MSQEAKALGIIAKAFPGVRVMPMLHLNPDGLAGCTDCLHPQAHSTCMVDANGIPWHYECLLRAQGLSET